MTPAYSTFAFRGPVSPALATGHVRGRTRSAWSRTRAWRRVSTQDPYPRALLLALSSSWDSLGD